MNKRDPIIPLPPPIKDFRQCAPIKETKSQISKNWKQRKKYKYAKTDFL